MTFLNPAILFGLLAATIPIILHLLNLKKLKKIEFSTVAFLKELQKTKIRKVKIKQLILLVLRVLIILLLVLAFARPTMETVSIGGASSAAKTTALFLMDDSFSMSKITDEGSYLNISKKIVQDILNEFSEGDEVGIFTFSGNNVHDLSNYNSRITTQINKLDINKISGDIVPTIEKAVQLLNESENYNKELYILSDFVGPGFNSSDKLDSLFKKLDERTKVYSVNLSNNVYKNGIVYDLKIDDQIIERDTPINFSAKYKSNSESVNTVASLFLNGKRVAQKNIDSKSNGQLEFEVTNNSTSLINAFVEIEEDDIIHDNRSYAALYIAEKINVGLFYSTNSDKFYILNALKNEINKNILQVDERRISQIESVNLNRYDIIILLGANIQRSSKIKDYLEQGKNIILFPSENTSDQEFNKFFDDLNLTGSFKLIKSELNSTSNEFDSYDLSHPTFANIFENIENVKLGSPQIAKYLKNNLAGFRSIIKLADNSLFLSEKKVGKGSLLIYNVAPTLRWSDFPLKGIFAPLINKQIFYLSAKLNEIQNYTSGEDIYLNVSGKLVNQCRLILPDNSEVYYSPDSIKNDVVRYKNAELNGVYKLYSQENLIDYAVVNVNPDEAYDITDQEEKLLSFENVIKLAYDENYIEEIKRARFGSELWRYFLIFAFLLAVIEMIVAKNTKKELLEFN